MDSSGADFMSRMALELNAQLTMKSTGDLIAEYARIVTAADEAGIVLVSAHNRISTVASTSSNVNAIHELLIEHDEGPCFDAIEDKVNVVVADTAVDRRWPEWGRNCASLGFRSALSVPLESKTRRYGALSLYAEMRDAFTAKDVVLAETFARHASVALAASDSEEGLHSALDARTFIGQAQGILMGRYGISADQAFQFLRRRSQSENIKLSDIAHSIIDERGEPDPS